MSNFVCIPPFFKIGIMGCHGNHEISKTQRTFIFEGNIVLHLNGPIGQIYAHYEMYYVFNLGLITPLLTIVYPCFFPIIFQISLIFMIMQMR